MQAEPPTKQKRASGIKQEVYERLAAGMNIDPESLAQELGCTDLTVKQNAREWAKDGNELTKRRGPNGRVLYCPGKSASLLEVSSKGFLPLSHTVLPRFGQLLQVTGIGAFDTGQVSVVLRDDEGNAWAASLTAQKE